MTKAEMTEAETMPETPADLQAAFAAALRPGERLLWAGTPNSDLRMGWSLLPSRFMGLVMLLVATSAASGFGISRAGQASSPPDFMMTTFQPFVTVLFTSLGFYFLIGRFAWNAYRRKRSLYAVTTERALSWYRGYPRRLTEIPLATLEDLTMIERPNDGGTIILGRDRKVSFGWPKYLTILAPRFELTGNALWVYRLVEAVRHRTYWLPY